MHFRRLLQLLKTELGKQQKLAELLESEREAVVKMDAAEIQEINNRKEKLLAEFNELEQSRNAALASAMSSRSGEPPVTFDALVNLCGDFDVKRDLRKVGRQIKELSKELKLKNDENAEILRHSASVVASTISIIRSATTPSSLPTYGSRGKLSGAPERGAGKSSYGGLRREI